MYHFLGVLKLPLLVLLRKIYIYSDLGYYFLGLTLLRSLVERFESKSLKRIFFFSSRVNLGWILGICIFLMNKSLMWFYFLGYLWNLLPLVFFFFAGAFVMTRVQKGYRSIKFYFFFLILSFIGLPPFRMFFLKLFVLLGLFGSGFFALGCVLLFSSIFLLYVYFKVLVYLVSSKNFFFNVFFGKRFFLVKYLYLNFVFLGGVSVFL